MKQHYSGIYKHMVKPYLKARRFRLMSLGERRCPVRPHRAGGSGAPTSSPAVVLGEVSRCIWAARLCFPQ